MLTTEADVRRQDPAGTLSRYFDMFVAEMKASGWTEIEVPPHWRQTFGFRNQSGETALLLDDDGIMLWVSSRQFPIASMLEFAAAATGRLRSTPQEDAGEPIAD